MYCVFQSKLQSYLSSFAASTRHESHRHERVKRSPAIKKVKKTKKAVTETPIIEGIPLDFAEEIATAPEKPKNFTVTPRQILKFEVDDAKYSDEYEKLKKSRKLRTKRDTESQERPSNRELFMQPRDLFRFSLSDAVTKSPIRDQPENSEKKIKREVSDSASTESKKVYVTSPMRNHRSTKHVKYEDISSKLQKLIADAIHDAVQRGKASDGDFLKFYYGDKIIKVPVSTKYAQHKQPKEHQPVVSSFKTEDLTVAEFPKLLATKNTYYPLKSSAIKYEVPSTTEKAESYANFKTPIVTQPESHDSKYVPYKKSVYYYTNDEVYYGKTTAKTSSPGPVLFEDSTTPSSSPIIVEPSKPSHYESFVVHPSNSPSELSLPIYKEAIPITESIDESYIPYKPAPETIKYEGLGSYATKSQPPKPTTPSYIEYHGSHPEPHEYAKNYEFG